jgi:hypothetical protein
MALDGTIVFRVRLSAEIILISRGTFPRLLDNISRAPFGAKEESL